MTMARERPTLGGFPERRSKQERMSISLPEELVGFVKARARERDEAQSAVIAEALLNMAREERRRVLMEGIIEDAEWNRELAREGAQASVRLPE
jgi:alpha-D-ribose 1-methylphosphonate 5-triphosphate synthase subunit PhnG